MTKVRKPHTGRKYGSSWPATRLLLAVLLLTSVPLAAAPLQEGVSKEEASAILQELRQIRQVLERIERKTINAPQAAAAKPRQAQIPTQHRPSLGRDDAPVTIVEVSDYQCSFCKRFAEDTLPALKKEYIDTGKVRLVYKDLPLPFHKQATKAAQAAHCAGEQGQYWEMHDKIFANANNLDESNLVVYAKALDLDVTRFEACLGSKRHLAAIEKDIADARKAGLTGTPSFVIGKTTDDIIKGDVVVGAHPLSSFRDYIEKHL